MTVPGNSIIQALFALAFVVASGYAAGRIHQWYKQGLDRDEAYRTGYDQASDSMFDLAIRKRQQTSAEGDLSPAKDRQHLVGHARRRIQADPSPPPGGRRRRRTARS
ncbi:hypothetical protein [Couchioplanes azureus]|uniref:hypothetical protein n=1 Tax=Couchioplanes caeruleus TaxID=56438 RepID=UPI001670F9F4|nr:hypothetical protein [Couchioplanes caeruleus]GGQ40482.1 hypothetical protein GCM10010166_04480 [Couchioplanes caeruleus subsp. azureus]